MATEFNLAANVKAERKLLVTCVNVETSEAPEWDILGAGIEDSSIEFNPEITTKTDILGITETTVDKMAPQQSFEPYTIRGGSKLAFKLFDIWQRKALSELTNFDILICYGFVNGAAEGSFAAEKQTGCTIAINSIGGSANVDFPITLYYSNNSVLGTVDKLTSGMKFSENVTV